MIKKKKKKTPFHRHDTSSKNKLSGALTEGRTVVLVLS